MSLINVVRINNLDGAAKAKKNIITEIRIFQPCNNQDGRFMGFY